MEPRPPLSILVDDDSLVRDLWTYVHQIKNRPFVCFSNVDDFLAALPGFTAEDFYYVDQDLNHVLSGSDLARDLIARGYPNVYLASGHEPEDLPQIPGLKGYVGKTPVD